MGVTLRRIEDGSVEKKLGYVGVDSSCCETCEGELTWADSSWDISATYG